MHNLIYAIIKPYDRTKNFFGYLRKIIVFIKTKSLLKAKVHTNFRMNKHITLK